jgi:hypothetical protein
MSEYQYYEWQTLDRPLTAEEQDAVNGLSSHIDVSSTNAVVTYEWSDFKHDPLEVLAKYFDAHLYVANWGSRRLAFRFPKGLLDKSAVESYCDEDHLTLTTIGNALILEFQLDREDDYEWVETDGVLATLARLRDDIIQGDYRVLYLAWLKVMELESGDYEDEDEDDPDAFAADREPPLPADMRQLTAPLKRFMEFFGVDSHLVKAAAAASVESQSASPKDFRPLIARLSRAECDDFLLKLANGEPGASAALKKKLLSFTKGAAASQAQQRTIGELREAAETLAQAEQRRQAETKRKKHIADMQSLATRESQVWQEIESLVQEHRPKNYDAATALLLQLQQLAEFQNTQRTFASRVQELSERYKSRGALITRWKQKGLL